MRRDRQKAFTLVEVMVALGILGILIAGTTTLITNTGNQAQWTTMIGHRDEIMQSITKTLSTYDRVRSTANFGGAAGNVALRACIDDAFGLCTVTSSATPQSFETVLTNAGINRRISGTLSAPARYSRKGQLNCNPATDGSCPFWNARTFFWAECPNNTSTCAQANTIYVIPQLIPARPTYLGRALRAVPTDIEIATNPKRYAISHRVVGSLRIQPSCPGGSMQDGYRPDGSIRCVCRYGLLPTGFDLNGHPICPVGFLQCLPGQLLVGRSVEGRPICRNTRTICGPITFDTDDATCPKGGWLTAIDLGQCRAGGGSKKSSSRAITCDRNNGTCCHLEPI